MDGKKIILRYANHNDYSWLCEHDKHISAEILKYKIANKEVYVVEKDGKIIGWLRYNLFWDNVPFMNMIYLLEEYRKMGIGEKLANYWEDEMKQKGYNNILTSTQSSEDAHHFYRRLGYKEIGGFKYLDDPYESMFQKVF
jgi:GNAT superfamily N-acetyltransferase